MEQKLVAVLNYDKNNNELSTVYKASQISEDSVLLGVFEKYVPGEEIPAVTNYVFFENTNEITNYFQVYYTKVRGRELYLDSQGEVSARYIGQVKTVTYAYEVNPSSLTPEQQTDIISQLGLDRELVSSAFESKESIRPTISNKYYYIPQRLAIMKYLDSGDVRDMPLKDLDGDMIEPEEDILYTVDTDRITYDKIDDYDLVYAEDVECYIDEYDATYITDADYYVLDTSEYYECDETHDWYTENGVVRDSYTTIARGLFDTEYFICDDCGEIHHLDNMCYDDYADLTYCEGCWGARGEGIIRGYHEGPGLVFYKTEETFKGGYRFDGGYGFELEVDDSSKSSPISLARDIDDEIKEVWLSHDGSLNEGLEIISHPMTLDYIMNNFDMNQLCDIVKKHGFKSHNTSTCGLHIHASRELFGKDTTEQELTIAKIILLFNRFFDDEIVKFSRRKYDRLTQWAKKSKVEFEASDKSNDISNKLEQARRSGRYQAVNLENRNTVEFRIFRGTNKASTILASIQFVDELINYAKSHSLYVCTLVKFNTLFKNTKHEELKNYLIDRQLMKKGEFKVCA